jgi:membrane protease YdiL (CAAX protease family)
MTVRPDHRELTMLAALVTINVALNRAVPHRRSQEIAAHVGAAGLMLGLATAGRAGAPPDTLVGDAKRGLRIGALVGAPIAAALIIGAFLRPVRSFFHDERIAGSGAEEAAYHLFARIPIATALCEELIFRVAVPAVFAQRRSRVEAEIASAALFGLWHILPTIDRLHTNPATRSMHRHSPARQAGIVAGTVAATTVGGYALSRLRDASGSAVAPIIVHAAINGGGFLGGWLSSRLERAEERTSIEDAM